MRLGLVVTGIALLGCSSGSGAPPASSLYDTCFTVDDCTEVATFCEELVVEFAGLEYVNAICTTDCLTEGPVSPECSRAIVGRRGSCYPSSAVGGVDDTLVCLEPCNSDVDCLVGFRCLTAVDLCGRDQAGCAIAADDAICVPGPG